MLDNNNRFLEEAESVRQTNISQEASLKVQKLGQLNPLCMNYHEELPLKGRQPKLFLVDYSGKLTLRETKREQMLKMFSANLVWVRCLNGRHQR